MLEGWLETHKRYPDAARQRGEGGRAILRFRVDRSGRVFDSTVVSGTGFPDLDESVESMLRGAMLPPFPSSMPQPQIEVSATIRFGVDSRQSSISQPPTPAPSFQSSPASKPSDVRDDLSDEFGRNCVALTAIAMAPEPLNDADYKFCYAEGLVIALKLAKHGFAMESVPDLSSKINISQVNLLSLLAETERKHPNEIPPYSRKSVVVGFFFTDLLIMLDPNLEK